MDCVLVGKSMLVVRRHVEAVDRLSAGEWADLRNQLARITAALRRGAYSLIIAVLGEEEQPCNDRQHALVLV